MADDVSTAELARRVEGVERAQRFDFVRKEVFDAQRELREQATTEINRRLDALEEAQKWAFRFLIGAFVAAIINGAFIVIGIVTK